MTYPSGDKPPWPIGSATNSKRAGWSAYFNGKRRDACPYPPGRRDLLAGYQEGWDAAQAALEGPGSPYRPSNGTEGDYFYSAKCMFCIHEKEHRETGEGGCEIYLRTMAFAIDHEDYPVEWVHDAEGEGTCTAWAEDVGQAWSNPEAVKAKQAAYEALPRDPVTGRPVI